MATAAFIISLILGVIMLIGLISPKRILKFKENPTRGQVFLIFGLPSFAMFILFGMLYESRLEVAAKDPEHTYLLKLTNQRLEAVPEEVAQLYNLEGLYLQENHLTTLPDFLLTLEKLELLNLADNPIESIPLWIAQMKSLKELDLENTNISMIPAGLEDLTINYKGTPLWLAEHPEEIIVESVDESKTIIASNEEDHSESLGEFAMRQLLDQDYGYKRKFKKGEIFYNGPVTQEQADQVGEIMVTMGFFNDEKEVSMLLDQNDDKIYEFKMVVDQSEQIEEEVLEALKIIRLLVQGQVFPDDQLHLHLTDGQFETTKIIKE